MKTSGASYEEITIHRQPGHGYSEATRSWEGHRHLAREHNVSTATFYQWRAKFGGMDVAMIKHLKELEAENARLKKMYA